MAGLGLASRAAFDQDEEVRRFQERRKAEERERIRREQEALEQRRRGYRPEDPQMGPDKRPYWPYDRPYVGPRVAGETIRALDNVPGVNRITGPAIMVADGISGKTPAPGEGPMPGRPRTPRSWQPPAPRPSLPTTMPSTQRSAIAKQNAEYHKRMSEEFSRREEEAYRRGDLQGRAEAIRARNWHDQQFVRWQEERRSAGFPASSDRSTAPPPPAKRAGKYAGGDAEGRVDLRERQQLAKRFQMAREKRDRLQAEMRNLEQQEARRPKSAGRSKRWTYLQEQYVAALAEWKDAGAALQRFDDERKRR